MFDGAAFAPIKVDIKQGGEREMKDLDIDRLKDYGFEAGQLKDLMAQFTAGLLPDFESLEGKIHERDWEQAKSMAHSFKGMLSVFVSPELVALFQALEDELKSLSKNSPQGLQTDVGGLKVRLKELHYAALAYQDRL